MRAEPQRERALELLRQRFPRHTYTLGIEVEACLHRRQYGRIIELLGDFDGQPDTPVYFRYALALARGLGGSVPWPYHGVIDEVAAVAPESAGKAIIHCAMHALNAGEIDTSIRLLLADRAWDEIEAREVARVIVNAVRVWAISTPSGQDPAEVRQKHERAFETIFRALSSVLLYLAEHPDDVDLRTDLTTALALESMGSLGLGILVHLLKNAEPTKFREIAEREPEPGEAATREQYMEFFSKYFESWDGRPLVGAPEPIRFELQDERLESMRQMAVTWAQLLASTVGTDPTDKPLLFMHLRIALDLTQHLGMDDSVFEILRVIAAARANAGVFQDARDLAENALLMFGERRSDEQKRAAWLVFADAYARCGNLSEAILGWLCAAQHQDVELTPSRMGQDVLLHVRLLRDVRLLPDALAQLQRAREILQRSSLDPAMRHRLEHLEATILAARRSSRDEADVEGGKEEDLDRLADLALRPLASALDNGDDPYPPATFVAQVIALHEKNGRPVPDTLRASLDRALDAVPPDQSARLQLLASAAPGVDDLLTLCRTLESTRFSGDLDMDLRYVRLVARRALDNLVRGADAGGTLLAIEVLAIHGVKLGGAEGTAEARRRERVLEDLRASTAARMLDATNERERAALARLLVQIHGADGPKESTTITRLVDDPKILAQFVETLGHAGIDIHALSLNSRDRLIRVSSRAGNLLAPVEEDPTIFDKAKLDEWRKEHPFCYCAPDGRNDIRGTLSYLEESLAGIGTTAESTGGASLYVVGHDLVDLPVNLIRVGGELAGRLGPVASVPSLTWLHATWHEPRALTGRRTAWFLPPSETQLSLIVLRDNLGEDLVRQGFDVVTDVDLPPAHRGGDLAIVGAHGSIWFDKRIFRAVSDDEKLILYSTTEFAARLSGTAVVVLLVCSGGRLDRDVLSFGATGLPYELLRRGCRAVVGSPWPLDVGMANRWAQHFVERWDTGATVVDAVHHANEALRRLRPYETHFLAMHIIGNPLERAAS
ncbi:MAG: CHAT domain-containing protein [Polyangiaceae bacterium]|nr:CHAT domain-containing protein [Polyangiaceae bacterium]